MPTNGINGGIYQNYTGLKKKFGDIPLTAVGSFRDVMLCNLV